MTMTLLADPALCTGCNRCLLACSIRHGDKRDPALARLAVNAYPEQRFWAPSVCFHCKSPACLAACPEQAILRGPDGMVSVEAVVCTGCGECVRACPWGMIRKHPTTGKAFKCDLCGGDPSCVAACPFEALAFVEESGAAAEAKARQMQYQCGEGSPEHKRDAFGRSLLSEASN